MRVAVYGLWHLGSVTAVCLAEAGHQVIALDPDENVIADLRRGRPPIEEPGLTELIGEGMASGRLSFTTDPAEALAGSHVLWVTFDTPVNERDEANVAAVRVWLEAIAPCICPGTIVLVSSQVPVGFTRSLSRDWASRGLCYACSPENLRLGKALDSFRKAERVVIGLNNVETRPVLEELFRPFCGHIEWMSLESAEMTKHAINAFLATSVTFINELARLCEVLGADAKEVERGLKSESRIGPKAYLSPGVAFSGGTLARDLRYLIGFGASHSVSTPLLSGALSSNNEHRNWLNYQLQSLLSGVAAPVVAILGLTYKPDTNTLRRSAAVELCQWLSRNGAGVRAHDPAIHELPSDLQEMILLCSSPQEAIAGADVAVVATEWPVYRSLRADEFLSAMRCPQIVDPNWFLAGVLAEEERIKYIATGRPSNSSSSGGGP